MTSVKDITVHEPAADGHLGRATFTFTDAYSVFDWGQMPDPIPGKGASLCTMGAYNFERLEAEGIDTHYRGVVDPAKSHPVSLDDVDQGPTEMAIDLARVPDLPRGDDGYDYDAYHAAAGSTYVIPLEVVFRNRVPVGSSLRRRRDPVEVGLEHDGWPDDVVDLPDPVIEFSTKYERSDRYLDRAEADRIAGAASIDAIETLARRVNRHVTDRATQRGFVHDDGKIEVVYHDGALLVADVVGTFDENRFTYGGQQVSKEVLRQYYRAYDPDWVAALEDAKAEAKARGVADWKGLCAATPDPLPSDVVELAGHLYEAGANAYIGRELLKAPAIETVLDRLDDVLATG